jgi:ferredoxin
MKVVCSYCGLALPPRGEEADEPVSHGMCPDCLAYFAVQWEGLGWNDYLERFSWPVLVVDADVRVLALNRPAEALLHRPRQEVIGLLGGEALECVYARLPGGCGGTVHCAACAIRRTITRTVETGQPLKGIPATLDQLQGTIDLLLDTEIRDGVVVVRVVPA